MIMNKELIDVLLGGGVAAVGWADGVYQLRTILVSCPDNILISEAQPLTSLHGRCEGY